jgi:eukaryotic-like serine/threonine-protein kinase
MRDCLPAEALEQLLGGALPDEQADSMREHLAGCEQCQTLLGRLFEDPELKRQAPVSWPQRAPVSVEPALARLLQKLHATPPPDTDRPGNTSELPDTSLDFLGPPQQSGDLGTLGPYRVLAELGRGGMGIVLRAYDSELRRMVALKVLPPNRADARARARFVREAQAAAGIEHDHVVPVYLVANPPGGPACLVMQYVEGPTLRERIEAEGRLDPQEAARIACQVAQGLEAAHRAGLVHRDIKPANIILESATARAKIMDFGLARMTAVPGGTTLEGTIPGTPEYMSPEQVRQPDRIDARSDVYSLGMTLYEALTGEVPFRGLPHLVLQQALNDEPTPPRRLNDKIPRDLETICLHCLHKEPGRRYASAQALADDLRRFLAGEPIQARPVRAWERAAKWARRRPAVAALLALVVSVTAVGFGLVTWQWRRAEAAGQALADKAGELEVKHKELQIKHYVRNIALAERELATGDIGRAEELLDECPDHLRGWEWHYLKRLRYVPPVTRSHGGRTAMASEGSDLTFSPDGQLLAAVGNQGVKVWETTSGRELFTLAGHTERVRRVAFRPDGRRLASAGQDGKVKVWDPTTGGEVFTLEGHTRAVTGLAFSPDGRLLASTDLDHQVRLWDADAGAVRFTFQGGFFRERSVEVAFSPDGRYLASGGPNNTVKLWDVTTGAEFLSLSGHTRPVFSVVFSPDGQRLASTGGDFVVIVWDIPTGREAFRLPPEYGIATWATAFSPQDGRYLAVGSGFAVGTVRVYDVTTGKAVLMLEGHIGRITSLTFSPDGRRLVTSGLDKMVRVWELETGQEVLTLRGPEDLVGRVVFDRQGQRLAASSVDGTVWLWDATPPAPDPHVQTLHGHTDVVYCVAFSPDSPYLASAGDDHAVIIWDAKTGARLFSLKGHTDPVFSVAFGPDGRLASASADKTVRFWDMQTRQEILTLKFKGAVQGLALSPDGRSLVTTDIVEGVNLWDTATGRHLLGPLTGPATFIHRVAYSPDGIHVAASYPNGTVRLWDATTGQAVQTLKGHSGRVHGLAFSPDRRFLASGDSEWKARIWDLTTGQVLHTLPGHTDYVMCVAFSPNGQYLASASWKEVKVWDTTTGQELITLGKMAGSIRWVAFSPDGQRLAAASGYRGKGEIKIWDATLWENPAGGGR